MKPAPKKTKLTHNSGEAPQDRSVAALVPIMAVVFVAYLVIGVAMPVLPLHVHQGLGLSAFVIGLVTGSQFGASVLSRVWAGRYADKRGSKRAVVTGLLTAVAAGIFYVVSLRFTGTPLISVTILLLGRALLGAAESFIITGAVSWGLYLAGTHNAGRVIAWVGMALFAALALGAPLGTALYATGGFVAVAIATILMPLLTVLLVARLPAVAPQGGLRPSLLNVAIAVWMPGFGSALSSIGFGVMIAFSSLLATQRGWTPVWLIFSTFAASLVVARLAFGHAPDRLGGARVALVCVLIEAAGLALIWLAPNGTAAAAGAALAGFGYSLVYPGLGVEAVRRAPPQSRGLAMGAYTVFLDVALGFGSPALGLVAGRFGLDAAFLASALIVLGGAGIALRLLYAPAIERTAPCLMSS
ncbi:MAG TPA: arabinose transporter [Xanthobacteraceae bacterium]|jgi:MFS family permease|nr:arabinose transporter [Xanthobacteraceae bacterium]